MYIGLDVTMMLISCDYCCYYRLLFMYVIMIGCVLVVEGVHWPRRYWRIYMTVILSHRPRCTGIMYGCTLA